MHWWDIAIAAFLAIVCAFFVVPLPGWFNRIFQFIATQKWEGQFTEDKINYTEKIWIFRIGTLIRGHSELEYVENNRTLTTHYRIRGVYKHAIISAHFEAIDKGTAEQGAFLIKFLGEPFEYAGKYLLLTRRPGGVQVVNYRWIKRR